MGVYGTDFHAFRKSVPFVTTAQFSNGHCAIFLNSSLFCFLNSQRGWEWNDLGTCDNSLSICTNSADAADNAVSVRSFVLGFYSNDGRNEITIVTNFTCTSCPTCIVTVSFFDGITLLESLNYTCSDAESSLVVTQEVDFTRVLYTAILPNTTDVQCVTIDSYRIYQYRDCPETAFELADYDRTDPGIGPVSSTGCVANAESAGVARAGCENGDWSVAPDSVACLCSAGFVPNENSTSCNGELVYNILSCIIAIHVHSYGRYIYSTTLSYT